MTEAFGARLGAAVAARGPLCVGIDPHAALLRDWGLPDDPGGLERFARTAVEAIAGEVAVVKPQSAFFERMGSRGVAVLERVLADIRAAGALALLDVKRGDIGSTMAAYADAYLDPASPLAADAITASPYLGLGSLAPLFETARAAGAGVFVLALTSNPEGAAVQQAVGPAGRTVAADLLAGIGALNRAELAAGPAVRPAGDPAVGRTAAAVSGRTAAADTGARSAGPTSGAAASGPAGAGGAAGVAAGGPERAAEPSLGSVGVVIGATLVSGPDPADLAALRGPILAPGLGAQGGTVADLIRLFGPALPAVLPSVSREVLSHGPDRAGLRNAVRRLTGSLAQLAAFR
ncbi:MAG TPA: orotidine-5'-phosphate decarboxylase [Mycobacteriales bacterium]|nr:orotidine-5'-phosphate decarboxylase [Mycobacteriales bacterium]